MNYKEIVEKAKAAGNFTEKQMWQSICSVADLLAEVKKGHPQMFWDFMREQHGIMFGNHYGREFAEYDVDQMYSTNKEGKKWQGAYWTVEQIEDATKDKAFPAGTTKWDKFVAFNAAKHDWGKSFDDDMILKIAYCFYFADEDFPKERGAKIWCYMSMIHGYGE